MKTLSFAIVTLSLLFGTLSFAEDNGNMDMMTGRDAITAIWQGAFDMGVTRATLTTIEALHAGPYANEYGTYEMFVGDTKVDWGKYMVLWRKDGAEWFLHRDMWNSSQPAK